MSCSGYTLTEEEIIESLRYFSSPEYTATYKNTWCSHSEIIETGLIAVYCKNCHRKGYKVEGKVRWTDE